MTWGKNLNNSEVINYLVDIRVERVVVVKLVAFVLELLVQD